MFKGLVLWKSGDLSNHIERGISELESLQLLAIGTRRLYWEQLVEHILWIIFGLDGLQALVIVAENVLRDLVILL